MRINARAAAAGVAFNVLAVFAGCKAAPFSEGAPSTADAGDNGDGAPDARDGAVADTAAEQGDGFSAPPTPASIFGADLSLWLDGSDAMSIVVDSSARVVAWTDRSPKKETTEVLYPRADDRAEVVPDALNGHPAVRLRVHLPGGDSAPILRFNSDYGSGDFMLTMIVSYVTSKRADLYLGGPDLIANEDAGTTITGTLFPATLKTTKGGWNDGAFHVVTLRRFGGTVLVLRVDGTEATLTIDPAVSSGLTRNEIGAQLTTGPEFIGAMNILDGSVAEIVRAYTGGTPAQVAELAGYIATKYGLTF